MVPRGSKVFIDANAIAGACDTGSQGEETLFALIQVHGPFEQEVELTEQGLGGLTISNRILVTTPAFCAS